MTVFRSALPRGERLGRGHREAQGQGVSIRAPARGATDSGAEQQCGGEFRSALPRGERPDRICADAPGAGNVSIRAPARGATPRVMT